MDFLDPRKRRSHSIRLLIGYFLVAIAIVLGARLLFVATSGFGYNTKTGQIIQNGLLFVDSQPGGADIYLNDKPQNATTSSRLIIPAGKYKLTLKKDGYRSWQRNFTLNEGSVGRYVYPFLFPVKLQPTDLKTYTSNPPLLTQSPDRRWLLVQIPGTASFDQYDTSDLTLPPKVVAISPSVAGTTSDFKEAEWSTDNKHLLLQHGGEFIILNRDSPAESLNVSRTFNSSPTKVTLRNKKTDQLYLYDQLAGTVSVASSSDLTIKPLLSRVLAFKPSGANLITYVTDQDMTPGQVQARIWDGSKSFPLYSFSAGNNYLIDQAQFQGHFYYIAGSDTDSRINLYKDPLSTLRDASIAKAIPLLSLNLKGASKVSFSNNTRFVAVEAGQSFAVYDIETQSGYHYTLSSPLADVMHWMDGHRLLGVSAGTAFVTDYDSTNQQQLVPTTNSQAAFFDRDYKHMLTTASTANGIALQSIEMRAGVDLPKTAKQ